MLRGARYWIPVLAAVACLYGASGTPPLVAYVLIMAAFGLCFDAATAWLARLAGAGGLKDFKQ